MSVETQEQLVHLAHQDHLGLQEERVPEENQALWVKLDHQGHQDQEDWLERGDQEVNQDQLVS